MAYTHPCCVICTKPSRQKCLYCGKPLHRRGDAGILICAKVHVEQQHGLQVRA